eukprot:139698-Ditylum_brightwellii.AAC.1
MAPISGREGQARQTAPICAVYLKGKFPVEHADTWVQDAKGNDMSILEKEINALKQKIDPLVWIQLTLTMKHWLRMTLPSVLTMTMAVCPIFAQAIPFPKRSERTN